MYRRRRPPAEGVAFNFDSFLDLVANVCGIIIRLILVAWVGARTYHYNMEMAAFKPREEKAPASSRTDDPLRRQLAQSQKELETTRDRLLQQLQELKTVQARKEHVGQELALVSLKQQELDRERKALDQALTGKSKGQAAGLISLGDFRRRNRELLQQIQVLEKLPAAKQILRYHTPVSKPVHADELMFECRCGRVTFIDLPSFMREIERRVPDLARDLEKQGQATALLGPIGSYRLHFLVEKQGYLREAPLFQKWVLEPISPLRGETSEQALAGGSAFRQIIETGFPEQTVVTFWVYPDSFALFRQLRDYLYDRGLEVAGRPLPYSVPIMGSSDGTASRGQ